MTAPRDRSDDFVATLLALIAKCTGGIEDQHAICIEEQIRADFGGDHIYIHRAGWFNRAERDAQIRADAKARSSGWLSRPYCLSRAHVHRSLKG